MGNVRKHKDITLVTANKTRHYLVLEPNYHTTKCFKLVSNRNETNKCKNQ